MTWEPIETAPKDGKPLDLWAKHWHAGTDKFETSRFPDCSWWKADSMGSWEAHWHNLPKGWRATHWMRVKPGPEASS